MLVSNTYFGTQFPGRARKTHGLRTLLDVYRQILITHVKAYNLIHRMSEQQGWPAPMVTFNNYCSDLYWSDKILLDLVSVRERGVRVANLRDYISTKIGQFEQAFSAARIPWKKDIPYFFGAYLKKISNWLGYKGFIAECFADM